MTTVAAVLASAAALIGAIAGLISALRNGRKIDGVHVLVNARLTDVLEENARLVTSLGIVVERVKQLTDSIEHDGNTVPDAPAIPPGN